MNPRPAKSTLLAARGLASAAVASVIALNGVHPVAAAQDDLPPALASDAARPDAGPQPAPAASEVRFNLADQPVTDLARFVAAVLAAEPVLPPDLPEGTIRWVDPRPYTPDEALALADAVFRTRGHSLSLSEGRLVVAPLDPNLRQPRELATHVVALLSNGSSALVEQLRPVLGESVAIASAGAPSRTPSAVVTAASAETCLAAQALIVTFDRIGLAGDIVAVPLRRTGAADARALLLSLLPMEGSGDGARRLAVVLDPRGGGLLLRGEESCVEDATTILEAIDAAAATQTQRSAQRGEFAAARFASPSPDAAAAAARHVLPAGVRRAVRTAQSPDGSALLLAGDAADLALWRATLDAIHAPQTAARAARLVRLSASDGARLADEIRGGSSDDLGIALDSATRELALTGDGAAVERAIFLARRIEGGRGFEHEQAVVRVNGDADALASLITSSAKAIVPQRGSEPPRCEPLPALRAVLLSGEPGLVDFAATLLDAVDSAEDGPRSARTFAVPAADAAKLVETAGGAVSVHVDASRAAVRASGPADRVDFFERELLEARGLRQRHRIARILQTGSLGANGAERSLTALLGAAVPVAVPRSVPLAEVRALPSSETLYVSGEPAQIALVARLLSAHDGGMDVFTTPLRLLEIRCGDAVRVAESLRKRFDSRDEAAQRARPVIVEGDRAGSALSVAMHPDMLAEVARAIDELDPRDDGTTARPREIFSSTLAQSDPHVVARALNGLFPTPPMPRDGAGHALPHLREPRGLHASGDPATRMVWIESSRDRAEPIEALVALLDRMALPPDANVRLFRLERGDISRVLQNLRDLAARGSLSKPAADGGKNDGRENGGAAKAVVVDADVASRTIVVVGDDEAFARTKDVLAQLGVLPAEGAVRVVDAGGVDPDELRARALKLAALEPVAGDAPSIGVTADVARGVLTAVGEESALERFSEACRSLVPRTGGALAATLLELEHRDAAEIADALEDTCRRPPERAVVRAHRPDELVVSGTRSETMVAEALVRSLDSTSKQSARVVATVLCRDAALPAEAIARWFATRGADLEDPRPVEVRATPDGDAVVVAAHPSALRSVEAMVRELGRDVPGAETRTVTMLPLRAADARQMARLFDVRSAGALGDVAGGTIVRADVGRNALVIAGDPGRTEMVVGLARQLDGADGAPARMVRAESRPETRPETRPSTDPFELRAITLGELRVERAAELVRSILGGEPVAGDRGNQARPIVAVGEDAVANRLLIAAPPAYAALADALVARLERDGSRAQQRDEAQAERARLSTQWIECAEFAVQGVDAEVAARVVETVIADRARWTAGVLDALRAGEPILAPRAVADPGRSRIFVSAPPQLVLLAEAVVARLSADRAPGGRWEMRVYPVGFDKLDATSNAVEQAIAARAQKNVQPPRIDIVAVPEGEALVAAGEPSWLDVVDSAVRSLEVRAPRDAARIRMVSLRHTEAFGLSAIAREFLAGVLSGEGEAAAPAGLVQALAEPSSNSVALLATPVALDLAEEILIELDVAADASPGRSLRLYELSSGEAAVAAKSIIDLFETDDSDDPLPTVRVQPSRNSLLVRASDKQRATVEGLVAKLDAKAPARARLVRTIEVSRGVHSVAEVAAAARRLGALDGRMALALDASRRSLVAFGTQEEIARLEGVVAQMESFIGELGADARIFELPASAEPRAVAALASAMLRRLASGEGAVSAESDAVSDAHVVLIDVLVDVLADALGDAPDDVPSDVPVDVPVDRGARRAVACIASAEGARMAEALLAALARGQNAGPIAVQACVIGAADVARVAERLRDEAPRADGTLRVVANADAASIFLAGAPREVESAAREIARLDGRMAPARLRQVVALPLRALKPADVVALVASAGPLERSGVTFVAEPVSNAVVLSGEAAAVQWQVRVLSALDDPAVRQLPPFEAMRVTGQPPSTVARAVLENVLGNVLGNAGAADPARRDALRLVADDERGILYVRVAPALQTEVRMALDAALAAPIEAAP